MGCVLGGGCLSGVLLLALIVLGLSNTITCVPTILLLLIGFYKAFRIPTEDPEFEAFLGHFRYTPGFGRTLLWILGIFLVVALPELVWEWFFRSRFEPSFWQTLFAWAFPGLVDSRSH